MATHEAIGRNVIAVAIRDAIDAGVGAGTLVFKTAGGATVAAVTFADPCGTVTSAVLTFSAMTPDPSTVGGLISYALAQDSTGAAVLRLTTGLAGSGADVIITGGTLTVPAAVSFTVTSFTYTAPL